MALRLDPVRLLIADDVGVGKTIEAGMVARELLDRGLATRMAVLVPTHLCDQWQAELRDKFGIDAVVVQPSTIGRLERGLPRQDMSIYQHYPHLICSIDFVKSDRHRAVFLQNAPDLVIVDEAHTATRTPGLRGERQQQRYRLVRDLADDLDRHLLLVTATPHSGVEERFRSLLGLVDEKFDLAANGGADELDRRGLVPHLVQRRRSDVEQWLGSETPFPMREADERTYRLSSAYTGLFEGVLKYCREIVHAGGEGRHQRVRYWAAIALLRCVLSSPGPAEAVLSHRAEKLADIAETLIQDTDELDDGYRPDVDDSVGEEAIGDYVPSGPVQDARDFLSDREKRQLAGFLREVRDIEGEEEDRKLQELVSILRELLNDGHHPIVFCRFISTAHYLGDWLHVLLKDEFGDLHTTVVTGEIADEARREMVSALAGDPTRILVATDCLSEGINLQEDFDAVVHYDLPWNPNRLEQREGRVDRFGQPRAKVKTILLYGADNPVDLQVLGVLIRKAQTIRNQLGITVPVPGTSQEVIDAIVGNVLLRQEPGVQLQLDLDDPRVSALHRQWDEAAARETRQRSLFSQSGMKPEEVDEELRATDDVLGDRDAVQYFMENALQRFGGGVHKNGSTGTYDLAPGDLEEAFSLRGFSEFPLHVRFDDEIDSDSTTLGRAHPIVSATCDAVLREAFGREPTPNFPRCGASFASNVDRRTVLLLLRIRYSLREQVDEFAEEVTLVAFERHQGEVRWLEPLGDSALSLLADAEPVVNMGSTERGEHVQSALDMLSGSEGWHDPVVEWRVGELQAAHNRIRKLAKETKLQVLAHEPPDVLGCFVLVPSSEGS